MKDHVIVIFTYKIRQEIREWVSHDDSQHVGWDNKKREFEKIYVAPSKEIAELEFNDSLKYSFVKEHEYELVSVITKPITKAIIRF